MTTECLDTKSLAKVSTESKQLVAAIDKLNNQLERFFYSEALGCGGPFSSPIQEHYKATVRETARQACGPLNVLRNTLGNLPACLSMQPWPEDE